MNSKKTIFILSVSSGIGLELAKRYLSEGCVVVGTYRQRRHVAELMNKKNCYLYPCDIQKTKDIKSLVSKLRQQKIKWDTFISAVGVLQPLVKFFEADFEQWNGSVTVNCLNQLRVLHAVHSFRNCIKNKKSNVVFFAGSGTNNVVKHMSAYISAKIFLIKMCEFLDAENEDLNVFIVGPGWTRTKAHEEVIKDKNTPKEKYLETMRFLKSNGGTDFQHIYDCIQWLSRQNKKSVSGRNFSVNDDPWGKNSLELLGELKQDLNMYKLRRFKNERFSKEKSAKHAS